MLLRPPRSTRTYTLFPDTTLFLSTNHRRSKHPKPADFHESVKAEIAWTIAPFIILLALAIPAAGTLIKMEDTRNSDLTVKVTGYQWKWQYEYVGENVSYFSTLSAASNAARQVGAHGHRPGVRDRKSTRLNSSH